MRLKAAQTLALYLLVWASLGTVFSADVFEWPLVLGVYGATVASLALPRGLRQRWAKSRLIGIGLVLFLGSTTLEILSGSRDIVSGATLFLIFVLVSRLFTPRTPTDATTLLTLSLVVVLAGSALNTSFAFAPFFILVIVCSIWALTTTHLSRVAAEQPEQAANLRISRGFLATTSILALVVFAQTTVFFLIFPRMGLGYFKPKVRTQQTGVGFSDRVELGHQGFIPDDGTVVLRLEFPEGLGNFDPKNMLFRGATLTQFDGNNWRRPPTGQHALRQRADGTFPIGDEPKGPSLHFFAYLEPSENDYVFAPYGTYAIRLAQDNPVMLLGRPRVRFLVDDRGDLIVLRPMGMAVPIEGWMGEGKPLEGDPKESLALPTVDPRVRALTDTWRGAAETPREIAFALTRGMSSFEYTREMVAPPEGTDPLAFFLIQRRAGHCEYFASALAVMLRLSGVPARVVNGYHGASLNKYGGYYTVQEYRAHSWVEYHDHARGWIEVDPTPPGRARDPEAVLERVAAFTDMLRYRWSRYVVEFDLDTQVSAVQSLRELMQDRSPHTDLGLTRRLLEHKWLIGGSLVAFAATIALLYRRGRNAPVVRRERSATRYLQRLERLMQKRGLPVRDFDRPPQAYLRALAGEVPAIAENLERFTEAYLRARFSPSGSSSDETQMAASLEAIARTTKAKAAILSRRAS